MYNSYNIPQLVPFYFTNQTVSIFIIISFILYITTKYILPRFSCLYTTRDITHTF